MPISTRRCPVGVNRTGLPSPLTRALLAGVLCASAAAGDAQATVVVPLSRAELAERSDLVVRVKVLDQKVVWNEDHTQILTLSRLAVGSQLKAPRGATVPSELVLRQRGGTLDGLASAIAGDGRLRPGDDAVLFLVQREGLVFLTALAQSVYHVQTDGIGRVVVSRDLHGLAFLDPKKDKTPREALEEAPILLETLVAEVAPLGARP